MTEAIDHRGNPQAEGARSVDAPEPAEADSANFFTEWQLEPAKQDPVSSD